MTPDTRSPQAARVQHPAPTACRSTSQAPSQLRDHRMLTAGRRAPAGLRERPGPGRIQRPPRVLGLPPSSWADRWWSRPSTPPAGTPRPRPGHRLGAATSSAAPRCRSVATTRSINSGGNARDLPSRTSHVLTVVDLADGAVVRVADERGVEGPRPLVADGAVVGLVPGCSAWWWCRSVRAGFGDRDAGGFLVDDGVLAGEGGDEGFDGEVVDRPGEPRETWWINASASSLNRVSVRPASLR